MADRENYKKKFEETLSEMESKYGSNVEGGRRISPSLPKTTTTSTSVSSTKQEQRRRQFDNTFAQMEARYSESAPVNDIYIKTFLTDAQGFLNQSVDTVNGLTWGSANSGAYDLWKNEHAALGKRAEKIQSYLNEHKDSIDPSVYKELSTALNDIHWGGVSVNVAFNKAKRYYSQWESDEHYFRNSQDTRDDRLKWYDEQIAKVAALEKEYQTADSKKRKEITAEMDSINAEIRLYKRGENGWTRKAMDDYYGITANADFASGSANRNFAQPTRENLGYFDAMMDTSQWYWDNDGNRYDAFGNKIDMTNVDERGVVIHPLANDERFRIQDRYGMWKNATEDDRRIASATREQEGGYNSWANAVLEGDTYYWDRLYEDEVNIYYYLLNTQGSDAASKFLDDMEVELAQRENTANTQQWAKDYDAAGALGKVFMNAASVPANVFGGALAFLDDSARQLKGEEINPYSGAHSMTHYSNTVRERTSEDIKDSKLYFNIPGINFDLVDLYQVGMSRLDSALATSIAGGAGTVLLGMGAASNEAYRLYQNGASEEQILLGAWSAGAAEAVFEYLSFDKLVKMKDAKTLRQVVKNALIQGGIEASEEGFTEAANIISNAFIMRNESDWAELIEQNGGSTLGALGDAIKQTVHSMVGGFLGGLGAGGVQGGKTYISNKKQQNSETERLYGGSQQELVNEALEINPDNTYAQKMQGRLDAGKNLSGAQLNRLVQQNEAALKNQDAANIQDATEPRLAELGETAQQAQETAEVADGQVMTDTQKAAQTPQAGAVAVAEAPARALGLQGEMKNNLGNISSQEKNDLQVADEDAAEATESQTFQKSTGKTVQVQDRAIFASIEGGNATALVDGKTEVPADDVSFGNEIDNLIFQGICRIPNMTVQGGNTIWQAYRSGQYDGDAANFGRQAMATYRAGYLGDATILNAMDTRASAINQLHKELIWKEGRKAATEHYRIQQEQKEAKKKADAGKKASAKNGGVYYGYEGQSIDERKNAKNQGKLAKAQKVGIDFVQRLSKNFGRTFYFYESYLDESGNRVYKDRNGDVVPAENGFYDPKDGSIHIDLNAEDGHILFTIAHELVHSIKADSPKHFKQLADIVMDGFSKKNVDLDQLIAERQAEAEERNRKLTEDEAYEEVIAHALEGVLSDGKVMDLMRMIEGKNKSLGTKVREFFQNISQLIQDTVNSYKNVRPESVEGRMIMRMEDIWENLQAVFAEGLYESGENFQKAEKNTATDGGVKFCSRENVPAEFNPTGLSLEAQLKDILKTAESFDGRYLYIGKFTSEFIDKVKNHIIIQDLPIVMNYRDAYLSMESKERGRYQGKGINYHNIGTNGMVDAIASFDDPDAVMLSKKAGKIELAIKCADRKGRQLLAIIEVNTSAQHSGEFIKAHVTTSIYGRRNMDKYLQDAERDNRLIYKKKKESTQGIPQVQYEGDINANSSKISIANSSNVVKQNDSTESDSVKNAVRRKVQPAVEDMLRKENESLREDIVRLKDLLKLQRTVTNGSVFRQTDVSHAAGMLKKNNNASGNTQELTERLNDFYKYIAESKDLSWEGVREKAMPAVNWLQDHVKQERSAYAQDVLGSLRGNRIYLDETQKAEVAYRFGSLNDFRRLMMGNVVIANDANMSLDSLWHELSGMYPDVFDPDTSAADMPEKIADIVDRLRNEDTSFMEYEYNREMIQQDLIRQVYDSYWRVSTVKTYADRMQAKINRIKSAHYQKVSELRAAYGEKIEQINAQHRAEVKFIRNAFRERMESQQKEITQHYQEARKRDVESRHRTVMRHKIQKVVGELNDLLLSNDKKRHVPENLKKAVADALSLVNMDTVGAEERAAKYADLIAKETDPDKIDAYTVAMENILRQGEKMGQRLKELRDAYEEIQASNDPDIANAYDPVIAGSLNELAQSIGDTPLRKMTIDQLQDVYDMYKMVLTRVRDANKSFAIARGEGISNLATAVVDEVKAIRGERKYRVAFLDSAKAFSWNNLKPVYAFERIGSSTFAEVFNNVRAGEDTWVKDVTEARLHYRTKAKKYGYDSWNFDKKYTFKSASGLEFELTLEQIMSLYAYSKRDQALDHLRLGGFVFDSDIETYKKKDGKTGKSILKYKVNTAEAHQISAEILAEITGKLSNQQKAFVDDMQEYLSAVMGAKGNEVTMKMYGVKLFKEKFYFPLKSARQFLFEQNEVTGEVKIKNSGFTNKVVARANNPVILNNFMDVWSDHINDMSMYHAFVLPLEDFNRIFNYKSPQKDGQPPVSVKGTIQGAYSPAAVDYVKQLITDLNGGAMSDPRETLSKRLTAKFKKAKVFSSLSVVIQQPSAIGRAFALIDAKYFRPTKDGLNHNQLWEELKQYAPVAAIKEMGYFDTNMGRSTRDFIKAKEHEKIWDLIKSFDVKGIGTNTKDFVIDSGYRDEVLSRLPALADEVTWCAIWNAVKRETSSTHKELRSGSDEFLKAAGERFTEVITKTQVYDSVLARSANMRSKSGLMSMMTSFMAEPTTTINMLEDAVLKAKRGDKSYARRAFASVMVSLVLNNALVALVYGMRDDDEDETYLEKYADAFTSNMLDDINPITYYPYLKDLWSLFQGYDVERADVSLFSDLADSAKALIKAYSAEDGDVGGAWWDFTGTVVNIFGIPMENIRRDVEGAINFVATLSKDFGGRTTTGGSLRDVLQESARSSLPVFGWGDGESKADKLYDAIVTNDKAYVDRIKNSYEDEKAYNEALRTVIKDRFESGVIDKDTAVEYLVEYCEKDQNGALADVQYWAFKQDYPDIYVDDSWFDTYNEKIAGSGISVEVYMDYRNIVSTITGEGKKEKRMNVINALPITDAQKDALYYAEGWAASKLYEAPWH